MKIFKKLSILICSLFVMICCTNIYQNTQNEIETPIRNVELSDKEIDKESILNKYEDAKLEYSKDDGYVKFSGLINYSNDDFNEFDLISLTNNQKDNLSIEYSFDYEIDENLFYLNVEALNTPNGKILDRIVGVPFENEKGQIDIVFDLEGDYVYLSELTENQLLENCGWFSRVLKKVAKAAAVVAVGAAVVAACAVAAPAVIAVASGTFMATSAGTVFVTGTVAASTLAACATVATTGATASLICSGIAATSYLTSVCIEKLEEAIDISSLNDISNNSIYYIAYLRNNQMMVYKEYALNYIEAASVLCCSGFLNGLSLEFNLISYSNMNDSLKNLVDTIKKDGNSSKKIGIYTEKKIDAAKLAFVFGGIFNSKPEIHGSLNDGYLYHFHDLLHLIHVWYRTA